MSLFKQPDGGEGISRLHRTTRYMTFIYLGLLVVIVLLFPEIYLGMLITAVAIVLILAIVFLLIRLIIWL